MAKGYSVVNEYDDSPCNMCGSPVTLQEFEGARSVGQSIPDRMWRRRCTNDECESKGGMSLADKI